MLPILFLFVPHFLVVRLRFELPTVVYRCSFFVISEHTAPNHLSSGPPPRPKTARSKTHPRSHLRWAQAWPRHAVRPMGAHGCRTGPPAEADRRELPLIDSRWPTRQGPKSYRAGGVSSCEGARLGFNTGLSGGPSAPASHDLRLRHRQSGIAISVGASITLPGGRPRVFERSSFAPVSVEKEPLSG